MVHRKELERIKTILTESKATLEEELKTLPEGKLYCYNGDGRWYYYELFPAEGNRKKEKRVGISQDTEKIFALVRKRYITKALDVIEKDIKVLEKAIKSYINFDEESLMSGFFEKHPELIGGIYHGQRSDEAWANDYEKQKDFYEKEHKHTSLKGEKMISKNEIYISSRLDHYKIPYRYEGSAMHPDVSRIPDFVIRRPRDGKIIYWEHLGLTGDDGYMSGNDIKFMEYKDAGIVPWDNLIITYDTVDGGIDARIIEGMILGWLL